MGLCRAQRRGAREPQVRPVHHRESKRHRVLRCSRLPADRGRSGETQESERSGVTMCPLGATTHNVMMEKRSACPGCEDQRLWTDEPETVVAVWNSNPKNVGGFYVAGWTRDGREVRVRLFLQEEV